MQDNPKFWKKPANTGKAAAFFERAKKTFVKLIRYLADFFILCGKKIFPVLKAAAPCLLFGAVLFVLLFWSGLGSMIGNELAKLTGRVLALVIIFLVCLIPSVSPLLGPGFLIAIAAGVLTGEQIAGGEARLILALASLLAIDAALGGSFIPPGHVLGENEPETISAGVPGIVFTRLITLPAALVLACLLSFK